MDRYKTTVQTWDKLAEKYQEKFMDLDIYNDTYDVFCRLVEKANAKIFEIGCGPGNITKYLLAKRPDFSIDGIDVAPSMIDLARTNNPTATFKVMDCRKIGTVDGRYDAIICGFCMPYLSKEDCDKLIGDCALLLKPGGVFYFSVIEDDYSKSGFEKSSDGMHTMFVYCHQENHLQEALKLNDFGIELLSRKSYPKADGSISVHLIIIARKNAG